MYRDDTQAAISEAISEKRTQLIETLTSADVRLSGFMSLMTDAQMYGVEWRESDTLDESVDALVATLQKFVFEYRGVKR